MGESWQKGFISVRAPFILIIPFFARPVLHAFSLFSPRPGDTARHTPAPAHPPMTLALPSVHSQVGIQANVRSGH